MLRESFGSQSDGEPGRHWFSDDDFDLVVWFSESGTPVRFQLCYDKQRTEHALTWSAKGFSHDAIDGGEENPTRKGSPILVQDDVVPKARLLQQFSEASQELQPALRGFVLEKLRQLPGSAA